MYVCVFTVLHVCTHCMCVMVVCVVTVFTRVHCVVFDYVLYVVSVIYYDYHCVKSEVLNVVVLCLLV